MSPDQLECLERGLKIVLQMLMAGHLVYRKRERRLMAGVRERSDRLRMVRRDHGGRRTRTRASLTPQR